MSKAKHRKPVIPVMDEEDDGEKSDVFTNRISIEEMRKIWNDKNRKYTDDELYRIRDWLYTIANVVVNVVDLSNTETLRSIRDSKRVRPGSNCITFVKPETAAA